MMLVLRSSKLKDIVGDRGQRSIWKVVAFGAQSAFGRGVCRAPLTGIDPQWLSGAGLACPMACRLVAYRTRL